MAYTTIDDPSEYFDVTLWTGTGGARTISGLNHKPDLIWTKTRSVAYNHMWSDSSRGFNANSELGSNSTAAEGGLSADVYGYKSGHTSDGWTMVDGTDSVDSQEDGNTNQPSVTYVGWTWAANGGSTTSVNASGTVLAGTHQANTTAGFSIVTYTGEDDTVNTVTHGLGAVPAWIIVKGRSGSGRHWRVYHHKNTSAPETDYLRLNETGATADDVNYWYDTAPTSSVFSISTANDVNANTETYVAYCWAEIQGYSKFGSYTGNGDGSGPFVYTGFRPAWIMTKRTDSSTNGDWAIYDYKRSATGGGNANNKFLRSNSSAVEASATAIDILSNGFKIRSTSGEINADGSIYVYMAFAEHPFVSSEGVPTTAV